MLTDPLIALASPQILNYPPSLYVRTSAAAAAEEAYTYHHLPLITYIPLHHITVYEYYKGPRLRLVCTQPPLLIVRPLVYCLFLTL